MADGLAGRRARASAARTACHSGRPACVGADRRAVSYDPIIHSIESDLAARILWLDAYVTNVDRTPRNSNMLSWHRQPWLIEHGATLYFHHSPGWENEPERARTAFAQIKDHVLYVRAATPSPLTWMEPVPRC